MNERPSTGSGVVGYLVVLIGVVAFVLSCFLPYRGFFGPEWGLFGPTPSFYRVVTTGLETPQYVGGLLFLFGGAATVAWVALAGLRHGHHERRRTPSILVAVTVAWSSAWIGVLVSQSGGVAGVVYRVGYWSMLVSVGVIVVGTLLVWVSGRQMGHEPDSAAGPEPPTEVPVG
jgi:hypothetical protein